LPDRFAIGVVRIVGRSILEQAHEFLAVVGRAFHVVARLPQGAEHVDRAGRGVESDTIADSSIAVGIVGKNERDPLLRNSVYWRNSGPASGMLPRRTEFVPDRERDV
jgi:hypothetical protein